MFPALQVIHTADSKQAYGDNLYSLCHRITHAIIKSSTSLNHGYFLTPPGADNYTDDLSFDTSDNNEDDDYNENNDGINDNIEEEKVTSEDNDEVDEDVDL